MPLLIRPSPHGRRIILSQALDSRSKLLSLIYVFAMTGICYYQGASSFHAYLYQESILLLLITVGIVVVYCIAVKRLLGKALRSEEVVIEKNRLTLVRKGFFKEIRRSFSLDEISGLRQLRQAAMTPHPLAGQSTDYLGFQVEQARINDIHGEARIAFDTPAGEVHFGQDVYQWQFDELSALILECTGHDLTLKTQRSWQEQLLEEAGG